MKYHPILLLTDDHRSAPGPQRRLRGALAGSNHSYAPVGTTGFRAYLVRLGEDVATHGISRFEPEVSRLIRLSGRHGLASVSVDVLADRSEPSVARERALGRVMSFLAGAAPLPIPVDAA
jgi:hypothetical protein